MEDTKDIITIFIPAQALESHTKSHYNLSDKLTTCARRYLKHGKFTGEITSDTPNIFLMKHHFNKEKVGYDIIARLLPH